MRLQRLVEVYVTDDNKKPKASNGKPRYDKRGGNGYGKGGRDGKPWKKEPFGKGDNGNRGYEKKYDKKPETEVSKEAEKPKEPVKKVMLRTDLVKSLDAPKSVETKEKVECGVEILYEDNHLLVVIKPQNVPTQGDSSGDPDLLNELKAYLIKKYDKPGDAYLGLLHRLDRPTGGVMVFAKTSKSAARLSEQIREGDFEKTYAAVTVGKPNRSGKVEHYLVKDEATNTVSLAPSSLEGAKLAVSEIETLDEADGMALVKVKLLTGRTHQARVQLKALGAPIVGDGKYGGDKLRPAPHLALWAYKLEFTHPVSGDLMRFIAQPPQEFPWTAFDTDAMVDAARPARTE